MYSSDGVSWSETNVGGMFITYGDGKFFMVSFTWLDSQRSTIIKYSVDGINWTEITTNDIYGGYTIAALVYGGSADSGRLILGTVGGGICYSDVLSRF